MLHSSTCSEHETSAVAVMGGGGGGLFRKDGSFHSSCFQSCATFSHISIS